MDSTDYTSAKDRVRSCWLETWQKIPLLGKPEKVFDEVASAYEDPRRHYHTIRHVDHLLRELTSVRTQLTDYHACVIAGVLHDVVYRPRSARNEAESSGWAFQILEDAQGSPLLNWKVCRLILYTDHKKEPGTLDGRLLCDADMAILGTPPTEFDEYDENILREYTDPSTGITNEQYTQGRRAFIEGTLAKPRIFLTDLFAQKYEASARENLTRARAKLVAIQ